MTLFLIVFLLQVQFVLPVRSTLEDPAASTPVPKQLQKDYDKLWKRFLTGKEDAKVFVDLDKFLKKNPDVLPAVEVQTYIDLYAGRLGDAERRLQSVLAKQPSDPMAALYLGEFAYSRGDFLRAHDLYSRLRTPGPSVPGLDMKRQRSLLLAMEGLLQEARRAAAENRLADAERSYRRALQLAPREPSLHGQLAGVLKRAGKAQEAEAELRLQTQYSGPVSYT